MPSGTAGFFVFDYSAMDTSYGQQAFSAIYECIKGSPGVCAFNDGDINPSVVSQLAQQGSRIEPSGPDSPLSRPGESSSFGAYFASMWTDRSTNFSTLHRHLTTAVSPGYLGCIILAGAHDYAEFEGFVRQRLYLPQSIALKDGNVIKGTAKYGIGIKRADAELLQSSSRGDAAAAKRALASGADPDCIDYYDRVSTPLIHAVTSGHTEIVDVLLSGGANPDVDNGSNSALMLAARYGHAAIVQRLLAAGADPALKVSGGTALEWAELEGHREIGQMLRAALSHGRAEGSRRGIPNEGARKWWQFWK